jgi:hypothetical protein
MKKLSNLMGVLAVASMAAVFTGCGDEGGDDGGGGGNPPAQNNFAPGTEADLVAANKTYTVNVGGESPITLTFPSAGNYQAVQDNTAEIGTYSGAAKTSESWQLNITPAAGQAGAQEGVLQLTWTGANAGTATFTPTGQQAQSGTFTVSTTNPNPDPDPDPGTNTNTNTLVGKTLQINYAGGGGDKFQFTSDTAVSWENGTSTGTYTANATRDNIDVILGDGQVFDITLSGGNQANVAWQQGNETGNFSGTYTLQ